ncbi:MAG: hypothetical protein H6990_05460 [Pseudomonadales bacterium]|nr:hypothetical protein [Pseudomonadales bacterium]
MTELSISLPGLLVALFLPWLVGAACARPLLPGGVPGRHYLVVGFGYFLGCFLAALALRLADALGAPLQFFALAIALGLFGLLVILASRPAVVGQRAPGMGQAAISPTGKALVGGLLALLAWRYLTLLGIVVEQPLFGWDAMMNWAPKAIVWFHRGELSEFVAPGVWLREATAAGPYTLGNPAASTYPEMVPLVFLWHMLGAGTWDHPLLQLPWLLAAINLGLVFYGLMRMAGAGVVAAVLASYCLLSLPYLNIHTAIAGYADLWLAAIFSFGAIGLHEWEQRGRVRMALAVLVAAVMCMQLKNPGIVLGLLLLLGVLRIRLALRYRTELLIAAALAMATALAVTFGLALDLPGLGHLSFEPGQFQVAMFGPEQLSFHTQVAPAVLRSLFDMANWHLLWYLAAALLLRIALLERDWRRPGTLAVIMLALASLYFVVFFFSKYYYHALTYITLNRAVLYVMPVLVFWLFTRSARAEGK